MSEEKTLNTLMLTTTTLDKIDDDNELLYFYLQKGLSNSLLTDLSEIDKF